jgi:hypothetical protein
VEIAGLVEWPARLLGVIVGNENAILEPGGKFRAKVALKEGLSTVNVIAVTADSRMHQRTIELVFNADEESAFAKGRRYALLVAVQDYSEASGMRDLETPVADVTKLAEVLKGEYGFQTELDLGGGQTLSLLLDDSPGGDEIEYALYQLGQNVGAEDSVLIYYAGHGAFEVATSRAYWIPADAKAKYEPSYLSSAQISDAIKRIQARSVLLISDSCFSGALLRGGDAGIEDVGDEERTKSLLKAQSQRSRTVITSGRNEPVLDSGGGAHSIFAKAMLTGLQKIDEEAFFARELFGEYVLEAVAANADQEPQFRVLDDVGHEGGDFVFVRMLKPGIASPN